MSDKIYEVPAAWKSRAYIDDAKYEDMYARSIKDPNGFWGDEAKRLDWIKKPTKVKNTTYDPHNVSIKWFEDGTLNASYNCVDRHHLYADDSRSRGGAARLRPYRRGAFGDLRRLFAGLDCRPS